MPRPDSIVTPLELEAYHRTAIRSLRDEFGKQRIAEGVYTPGEIDVPEWVESIESDYRRWRQERE